MSSMLESSFANIRKTINILKQYVYALQVSSTILFILLIYLIISLIDPSVWNLSSLSVIKSLLRWLITAFIVGLYSFIISSSFGGSAVVMPLVIIAYIGSFLNFDIGYIEFIHNPFSFFIENSTDLLNSFFIVMVLVVILLGVGFIRTGKYNYTLWSFLAIITLIIVAFIFDLTVFSPEDFAVDLSDPLAILYSKYFYLILFLYFFLEITSLASYFSIFIMPTIEKFQRISRSISLLRVKETSKRVLTEEKIIKKRPKKLVESLSPVAAGFLKDAYAGYAFLGEGSAAYISAKLRAYFDFTAKKNPEIIERISGLSTIRGISQFIARTSGFMILKLLLAIPITYVAFLSPTIISLLFPSEIVEIASTETIVFTAFLFGLIVFWFSDFLFSRYKKLSEFASI